MSETAFAEEPETYKITITNSDQTGTHTYSAYKILSGDLIPEGETNAGQLQNVDWAITPAQANALLAVLKADTTFGSGEANSFASIATVTAENSAQTAVKFAQVFNGETKDSAKAKALAAALGKVVSENSITATKQSTTTAAADAKFTVTADTETSTTSTTGYVLKDFTVTSSDGFEGSVDGAALTKEEGSNSYTVAADTGNTRAAAIIKNQSGATLPETGGVGTTLFYVIGAVHVLGAGIVLVTRRRMSAN